MEEDIRILVVEPKRKPFFAKIERNLREYYRIINGNRIEVIADGKSAIVLDEGGKIRKKEPNRIYCDDILAGTFFCCGIDGDDFCSIEDEEAERLTALFDNAEIQMRLNNLEYWRQHLSNNDNKSLDILRSRILQAEYMSKYDLLDVIASHHEREFCQWTYEHPHEVNSSYCHVASCNDMLMIAGLLAEESTHFNKYMRQLDYRFKGSNSTADAFYHMLLVRGYDYAMQKGHYWFLFIHRYDTEYTEEEFMNKKVFRLAREYKEKTRVLFKYKDKNGREMTALINEATDECCLYEDGLKYPIFEAMGAEAMMKHIEKDGKQ